MFTSPLSRVPGRRVLWARAIERLSPCDGWLFTYWSSPTGPNSGEGPCHRHIWIYHIRMHHIAMQLNMSDISGYRTGQPYSPFSHLRARPHRVIRFLDWVHLLVIWAFTSQASSIKCYVPTYYGGRYVEYTNFMPSTDQARACPLTSL